MSLAKVRREPQHSWTPAPPRGHSLSPESLLRHKSQPTAGAAKRLQDSPWCEGLWKEQPGCVRDQSSHARGFSGLLGLHIFVGWSLFYL